MSDSQLLHDLTTAALEAGAATLRIYHGGFDVHTKADASPVTTADHVAEEIILGHLARVAPGIEVVAEEQAAAGHVPAVGAEFFLVDPLDGTKEFVHRRGDFTVNIALVRDVDSDPFKATLASKIIEAARHLNMGVVAEGIETEAEFRWMRENGATLLSSVSAWFSIWA